MQATIIGGRLAAVAAAAAIAAFTGCGDEEAPSVPDVEEQLEQGEQELEENQDQVDEAQRQAEEAIDQGQIDEAQRQAEEAIDEAQEAPEFLEGETREQLQGEGE